MAVRMRCRAFLCMVAHSSKIWGVGRLFPWEALRASALSGLPGDDSREEVGDREAGLLGAGVLGVALTSALAGAAP